MALNERKSIESIEKCRKVNQMGLEIALFIRI